MASIHCLIILDVVLLLSISKDIFSIIVITNGNERKYVHALLIWGNMYTSNKGLLETTEFKEDKLVVEVSYIEKNV